MADSPDEAAEVTESCHSLVLNMGTPSKDKLRAMLLAGARANALGHPVVLDPVGLGVSGFRQGQVKNLLEQVKISLIRGNFSEISALAGRPVGERGVDSLQAAEEQACIDLAKSVSRNWGCAVLLTGKRDIAAHGEKAALIFGGHEDMSRITGAGCMLSAVAGAFLAVCQGDFFQGAVQASLFMKLCGEYAAAQHQGTGTMRIRLIDRASALQTLEEDRVEYQR